MKMNGLDSFKFNELKRMLNSNVYWLDKNNNYKIYKFEVSRILIEPVAGELRINLELDPVSTNIIQCYHESVEVSYENFFDFCTYSYDAARRMQYKKLYERQGSLF